MTEKNDIVYKFLLSTNIVGCNVYCVRKWGVFNRSVTKWETDVGRRTIDKNVNHRVYIAVAYF